MKTAIINQILELKTAAINANFDFPTEDIENSNGTLEEFKAFLQELKDYLEEDRQFYENLK
jgi:tRNA U34 5-carboxymethylaminomethyl modifying GTPase MnmE/TrmE